MNNACSLTDGQYASLKKRLLAAASENSITCAKAIAIAGNLKVPAGEISWSADTLHIRISKCQLGCAPIYPSSTLWGTSTLWRTITLKTRAYRGY